MSDERRGPWYLITGLIIGLFLGLLFTILFEPVHYVDAAPDALGETDKDQYRGLIALAFQKNTDLGRAKSRLDILDDKQVHLLMEAQAQRFLSDGQYPDEARALAELSLVLQNPEVLLNEPVSQEKAIQEEESLSEEGGLNAPDSTKSEQSVRTATPQKKPTFTQAPTFTPRVTAVPSEVLGASFVLDDRRKVCDQDLSEILLQVEVLDPAGNPIPGVRFEVSWDSGEDFFFTGLYPQISLGYADFSMVEDVSYHIKAGTGGEIVMDLQTEECVSPDGESYLGGWYLTFIQP
ncbi:MAG: hypothetical protein JEZ06_22420 [Anaerolineaceae bacterium]|nr:hypothetical protein [Anaerolineaceae bacterium]